MSNKMTIEDGINMSGLLTGGIAIMGPEETMEMMKEYMTMYGLDKKEIEDYFMKAKDKLRAFMDNYEEKIDKEEGVEDNEKDDKGA